MGFLFNADDLFYILRKRYLLLNGPEVSSNLVPKKKQNPKKKTAVPVWAGASAAGLVIALIVILRSPSGRIEKTISGDRTHSNTPATNASIPASAPTPAWREKILALPQGEQAEAFSAQGDELLSQGHYDEAAQAYRFSLERDPESESVYYNLGIALVRAGKVEAGIAAYREALRIAPDYAEAHNNLGNILLKQGQNRVAADHFRAAIEINPDVANGHNNLGIALAKEGQHAEAETHFQRAVELEPNYLDAHFNLAQSFLARGDYPEAERHLKEALRIEPAFKPARQILEELSQSRPVQK